MIIYAVWQMDTKSQTNIFVVAPCMLMVLSPLFVQLMHTNYYKTFKQLKSFKFIIVAPTRLVYINHHQGALSLCFPKVTMLTLVTYIILLCVWIVHCAEFQFAQCTIHTHNRTEQNMQPQYR